MDIIPIYNYRIFSDIEFPKHSCAKNIIDTYYLSGKFTEGLLSFT